MNCAWGEMLVSVLRFYICQKNGLIRSTAEVKAAFHEFWPGRPCCVEETAGLEMNGGGSHSSFLSLAYRVVDWVENRFAGRWQVAVAA